MIWRRFLERGKAIPTNWLFLIVSILAIHLWSLLRYPAPNVDEVWLTSRAWAFIQTGKQFGPLDSGIAERFPGYWTVNQWLITALQSLVLRLSPIPSLVPLRLLSLFWGAVLLLSTFWIARRTGGIKLAWWGVLFVSLSLAFFYSAHEVRYDIMAAALGYLAVALYLNNPVPRLPLDVLAGVLVGLAVETHLNSFIFIPTFAVLILVELGWKFFRSPRFWAFVLGGLAGLAFYLYLHIIQFPKTFFYIYQMQFGNTHVPGIATLQVQRIAQGLLDALALLLPASGAMALLALLALPALIRERSRGGNLLLALSVTLLVSLGLIVPNKTGHYAILLAPAVMLLAAAFFVRFLEQPWKGKPGDYLSRVVVWGAVAGTLALSLVGLTRDANSSYQQTQARVNQFVRPGDVILGTQVFWLGLVDHPYYSWELLFSYPRFYPGKDLADAFAEYHPDVLIIDQPTRDLISDAIDPTSRWYDYRISKSELSRFLDRYSTRVDRVDSEIYGTVEVFRLSWPTQAAGPAKNDPRVFADAPAMGMRHFSAQNHIETTSK